MAISVVDSLNPYKLNTLKQVILYNLNSVKELTIIMKFNKSFGDDKSIKLGFIFRKCTLNELIIMRLLKINFQIFCKAQNDSVVFYVLAKAQGRL